MLHKYNASMSLAVDEKVEQVYDDIERVMADSDLTYEIIIGYLGGILVTKRKEEDFSSIEAFGIGELIIM